MFVIGQFSIKGNMEYTEEQALEVAQRIGLEKGKNLFGFDKEQLQKEAKYYLSEFDSVTIKRSLPDKIIFAVKEATPAMYIAENGKNYILSEGLRVISVTGDASIPENFSLIRIYINDVVKCQAGEFLQTSSEIDEVLKELYAVLSEEAVLGEVSEINLENKFAVSMLYKKRFTVKLGSADNFTVKVRFMKSIEQKLRDTDSGYIDVSDDNLREGVFKAYE
jgi:cell division septal protein FtsQ